MDKNAANRKITTRKREERKKIELLLLLPERENTN